MSAELEAVDRGEAPLPPPGAETAPEGAQRRRDEAGMPWLPRRSGRVPRLRPDLELTAATGSYDTSRRTSAGKPWTPSEARFAVLVSAAARGWRLAEVTGRMRGGAWGGLAAFYGRYRPGRQRAQALEADWKKAVTIAAGGKSGRASHTRGSPHTGGGGSRGGAARLRAGGDFQEIRRWDCALRAAERNRWPGAHGITVRLVARALAAAAQMTGSAVIEFGTRSLGLLACLDHSTVARVLRELRAEDDPFVVLLEERRGLRGDLYLLRIPDACAAAAAWGRWRPGRIGVHPVFRVLGGAAALVCEQLTGEPVRTMDLPGLTGLSATAVSTAVAGLAAHGIAARGPGGWRRGPASLDQAAQELGVPGLLEELQARYRRERQEWRSLLTLVRIPIAPAGHGDVPWPDAPDDDSEPGAPAAARAPPRHGCGGAPAVLEAEFGHVHVSVA